MLSVAMSAQGFPFQKSEKGVRLGCGQPPSSDRRYEEHSQLSKLSKQQLDVRGLLGIWVSALALFMARLLLLPLERTRQPFYKRFMWAALMVCLPKRTQEDGIANASSSKRPLTTSKPRKFATNGCPPELIRLPYFFCPWV
jgi:hypothetical protein